MRAASRRPAQPARVRLCVAAVTAAAALLLPASGLAPGLRDGPLAVISAIVLATLIIAAHHSPVTVGPKRKLNVGTAPEVAAVLLLPGPLAALTLVTGTVLGESQAPAPPIQRVFNAAVAAIRAVVGAVAYAGLSSLEPRDAADLAAVIIAPLLMYAVTTALVRGIAAVQLRQTPFQRSWLPQREVLVAETALSITGIMAALATAEHAWALPLMVGPAVIAQRAIRDGIALREQTRVTEAALHETAGALAVRDEFLSVAAHEFRTPMTALRAYLHLTLRRFGRNATEQEIRHLLTEADAQIARIEKLVKELTDVSHFASGLPAVECEPISLAALVCRVVEARRAMEPDRTIDLIMPDRLPVIMADDARLEQVLMNLLENAGKYSPPGAPVHVVVGACADAVNIAVRDEGVGIPPEDQEHIFERFHRARNIDRGISGLGLGLYIAHQLVRAHGGDLTVDSAPGTGSTFTIALPRPIELTPALVRERQLA